MAYLFKIEHPETGSSTTMAANTIVEALELSIGWLGGEFTLLDEQPVTVVEHVHAYSYVRGWDVCDCGARQPYFEMGA